MHVALRGRDPRVSEEILNEARIGVPGDQAAGCMTEGMKAQRAQPGGVARGLEAAADSGGIEASAKA